MNTIIISILTYNKLEYTKKCIESLLKSPRFPIYEIVVSDNGSTDGTQEYLKSRTDIKFIDNKENLGFSKAHNKVIKMYPENDIVLVNNDIEVPFGWLSVLYHAVFKSKLGAVSPAIQTKNGLDVGAVLDKRAVGKSLINSFEHPDWITGSCLYITRNTFDRIGLLSEDYKFYYEDVDFCFRMKQAKIKFECIRDVVIVHHDSTSSTPVIKKQMMEESRKKFAEKWGYNV